MNGPTELNGLENLANYSYEEMLEQNLISFLDWGFINVGGYTNNNIPTSGAYGGDFSRLRPVKDERYDDGQVWEAARMNWVYETGLSASTQPISISGLYVGSTFRPANSGYIIDYPHGRIIFDTAISQTSVVKMSYSSKWVYVTSTSNVPWLRIGQKASFRPDNSNFLVGSGDYSYYSESRIQLPAIAIEVVDSQKRGFQLGGNQWNYSKVNFFIIAEDKNAVDRLASIIDNQHQKTIYLYDANLVAANNAFPLNQDGSPINNFPTYPTLVRYSGDGGYMLTRSVLYGKMTFVESQIEQRQQLTPNLYQRCVGVRTEAILTNII